MVLNAGRRAAAEDLDHPLILYCPLRSTVLGTLPVGEIGTCWSRLTRGPTLSRCVTGRARTVRGHLPDRLRRKAGVGGNPRSVCRLVAVAVCFACVCIDAIFKWCYIFLIFDQ